MLQSQHSLFAGISSGVIGAWSVTSIANWLRNANLR